MCSILHDTVGYNPEILLFIVNLLEKSCDINESLYLNRIGDMLPSVISISQSTLSVDNPIFSSENKANVDWYHQEMNIGLSKFLLNIPIKNIECKKHEWCEKWGLSNVMIKISLEWSYNRFLERAVSKYLNGESVKMLNNFSIAKRSRVFMWTK